VALLLINARESQEVGGCGGLGLEIIAANALDYQFLPSWDLRAGVSRRQRTLKGSYGENVGAVGVPQT
jgi:hypothetical protein